MQRLEHKLLSASLGTERHLVSFHFGQPGTGPKIYMQASLHAEELPGMLVAHHLRAHLEAADAAGQIKGEIVLVPVANPLGLGQRLYHHTQGRFDLDTAENFNRHYPDLAEAIWDELQPQLTDDSAHNVARVRALSRAWLQAWRPQSELQSMRRQLMLLAHDADIVLDLHCDGEAAIHMYSEEACWPPLEPLGCFLGCQAVLLAKDSGGGPFDERLSGVWWQLRDRMRAHGLPDALPQACASTTVELRGEAQVSHALARDDAQAILNYLAHLGVLQTPAPVVVPPLPCNATPLAGSQTLRAPVPGLLVFIARPGDRLAVGDVVAEVIDPSAPGQSHVHAVCAEVAGVLYATVRDRYVHAGGEIGKIAGAIPFRSGDLLGA